MKAFRLAVAIAITLLTLTACSNSSDNENQEPSILEENVSISISSSNPGSTVIFEAINIGEWNGSAPADSQATPFEFTVSTTNFYGTFHKLEGNSPMILKLVGQKNGETIWETEKEYDQISQIILDGNFWSVEGK